MSNISHTDINLSELKNGIENDIYKIPRFQRDFVWKKSSIESLGDSIIRGYPISSILTMPVNGSLKISYESINVNKIDLKNNESSASNSFYVLDGQQRITSIARIFCNLDPSYQYFFDCLSLLMDHFQNDKLENLSIFKNSQKQYSNMEYLCVGILIGKSKGYVEHKEGHRFISAKQIIIGKYGNLINKFIRSIENEITEKKSDEYIDFLNFTFGKISQYGIPQTIIEGNTDLGVVCRVFEKINASGKKLTIFNLINAKSFEYTGYTKGLSQYLRVDLNSRNENEKEALRFYFEYDNDFENLARIARILVLSEQLHENKLPLIINSVMLKKKASYWFEMWDLHKENIIKSICCFYNDGILQISPLTYFEYMFAVICNNPNLIGNEEFNKTVKKYALGLSIVGRSFNKSDLDVVTEFNLFGKKLLEPNNIDHDVLLLKPSTIVNFDRNNLKTASARNNRFKAAYYIMTKEKYAGKFNRDLENNEIIYSSPDLQQHYLIPKYVTKGNVNKIFTSIANVVPINKSRRESGGKDMLTDDYLKEIEQKNQNKFSYLLSQNLLSQSKEYNDIYLEERLDKIFEYLINYFKE